MGEHYGTPSISSIPFPFSLKNLAESADDNDVYRFFTFLTVSLLAFASPALAKNPTCVSCEKTITADYTSVNSAHFLEKQPVCKSCNRYRKRCFECKLPCKEGSKRLKDNRVLCRRHAATAVLSAHEGDAIFRSAQREVMALLRGQGKLPDGNIEVSLVDRNQLQDLLKGNKNINANLTRGLTQTFTSSDGKFKHKIFILNGLPRDHTLTVAAHEYTHTWLAENVSRPLDEKTVEGFCELIAYKVAVKRNLKTEQKTILANAYTQGQLDSLRKATAEHRFHEIVRWFKEGTDQRVDSPETVTVLARKKKGPHPIHSYRPVQKTPVPSELTLKGISGTKKRRFALVNDRTLEKNERGKVRVGNDTIMVRCLDITANSVLLQNLETQEKVRLQLGK